MLRMITDLLDVAAIEAGQLQLDLQPADLAQFVLRNVTLNRVLAARKEIAVELEPAPEMPLIPLDAVKIEQVLNKLISNAVKFPHPDTSVRVRLTLADGLVTLAEQDQSQGIPAADFPKLFKPFSQTSVRNTAGEKSTDLDWLLFAGWSKVTTAGSGSKASRPRAPRFSSRCRLYPLN